MCLYEPMNGSYPDCNGACKRGKDNYCQFYFVDEVCALLERWKAEAHIDEPLLMRYDYTRKKLVIYTTKPGYLIGLNGERINKYSALLNEKLRYRFTDENGVPDGENFIELVECNDAII